MLAHAVQLYLVYGGASPKEVHTAFILPPTKSFCLYKTNLASESGVHFFWACTSVVKGVDHVVRSWQPFKGK